MSIISVFFKTLLSLDVVIFLCLKITLKERYEKT